MSSFNFSPNLSNLGSDDTLVVHVPIGLDTKRQLFDFLVESLKFPAYFGFNWDALDECFSDLSWLEVGKVVLLHQSIPLSFEPEERRKYLEILDDIVREKNQTTLEAAFPVECKDEVEDCLRR